MEPTLPSVRSASSARGLPQSPPHSWLWEQEPSSRGHSTQTQGPCSAGAPLLPADLHKPGQVRRGNQKDGTRGLAWWRSGKESSCKCSGHRFDPWFWEDPTRLRATKPMCHNYWAREATITEPRCRSYWIPSTLEPVLHKRSHSNEKPAHCN